MKESMEKLEAICDHIAQAISDVDGNLKRDQIDVLICEDLEPTEYTRQEFDEMFDNIYRCTVLEYVDNATDDASWAAENGLLDDDDVMIIEQDDVAEITLEDLGITVVAQDEIY